jgi:4-amino-4-deoxy-L-arabinose transferase-like glycosyltransferase
MLPGPRTSRYRSRAGARVCASIAASCLDPAGPFPGGWDDASDGREGRAIGAAGGHMFFAVLAQRVLNSQPADPRAGCWLYLLALVSLGAMIVQRRSPEWFRWPRRETLPAQRLLYPLALLLALFAQQTGGRTLQQGQPWLAVPIWLAAIVLGFYSLRAQAAPDPLRPSLPGRRDLLAAIGLFLLALLPRAVALGEHPFVVNGVEASLGLDALAIAEGRIGNPFAAAWLTNPSLPLFLQAIPLRLLGPNPVSVRLLSVFAGAATVSLIYLVGRRIWSEAVGLVAALLLVGSHWHVHYSRLGMTNIWDPFLALLALGLIIIARQQGTRRAWLWAGLAVGANAYVYTSSHLLPFILAALLLYFVLFDRASLAGQGRHMLAGLALAAVVALPQWRFYVQNPGIYMERANTLGIIETGWLVEEAARSGTNILAVAGQQLARAALAFNYSLDTSNLYNPGVPLLRFWPAVLLVLGSGVALLRWRQLRYALLLLWVGVTVLFAGALLLDPPASHRLLIAAPAVHLLAALGLVELARLALTLADTRPGARATLAGLGLLALLITAGDIFFYFGPYRAAYRFGDRNTEIAHGVANYLDTLPAGSVAYFHGPPVMYVDFPTIPFLARSFRPGENLFNVDDPAAPLPAMADTVVFIYIPERSGELEETRARHPGGNVQIVGGHFADPLFYAYALQP